MKSLYLPEHNAFIRYLERPGDGPTCVYLAGLMFPSVANFLPTVTHPNMDGHHALFLDYLGAGFSDHPNDFDYTLRSHAQAIAAVLDHEAINQCTVMGFSMGGSVGIMLAILRPDLVANLIVAEGNLDPGGGQLTSRIATFSEREYVDRGHKLFMDQMREAALEGDLFDEFVAGGWRLSDAYGIYRSSINLVNLDPIVKQQFFAMAIPRTFIYGGNNLPSTDVVATPDTPDIEPLKDHGIPGQSRSKEVSLRKRDTNVNTTKYRRPFWRPTRPASRSRKTASVTGYHQYCHMCANLWGEQLG